MSITPRTAEVVIYQGDDLQKLADLRRVADTKARIHAEAQKAGNARYGDDTVTPMKDAQAAYDTFVAEAAERAEIVVLRALGRRQWRDLVAENPPRRVKRLIDGLEQDIVHEDDVDFNVDIAQFAEKLATYVDPTKPEMRTIAEPRFPTAAGLSDFIDELSGGDFDRLWITAFHLNGTPGGNPKETTYGTSPALSETAG